MFISFFIGIIAIIINMVKYRGFEHEGTVGLAKNIRNLYIITIITAVAIIIESTYFD